MLELIDRGGNLMWLLLGCSLITFLITIERLIYFRRAGIDVGQMLKGLANLIQRRKYAEALQHCAGTPGPVARVLHSALIRHDYSRSQLKDIVQEAGQLEVPRIERSLSVLLTIAYVAPLIGLLGTLSALITTFLGMEGASGFASSREMVQAIYASLITSATGLVVAIPAFVFYTYLGSKARNLMHEMERGGIEILNLIEDSRQQGEIIAFSARSQAEAEASSE